MPAARVPARLLAVVLVAFLILAATAGCSGSDGGAVDDVAAIEVDSQTVAEVVAHLDEGRNFARMFDESGLSDVIAGNEAVIIVVPTDDAIESAGVADGAGGAVSVADVVSRHVVGQAPDERTGAWRVTTLAGTELAIAVGDDGTARVDGRLEPLAVYRASNGTVYVVDSVL